MKRNRFRLPVDPYFLCGLVAVLVLGAAYRLQSAPATPRPDVTHLPTSLLAQLDGLGGGVHTGQAGAPVEVVELTDYQCPACAAAHRSTGPMLTRHVAAGRVRFTTYDLPLASHANAVPAALVARCVARTDTTSFWELRHGLFSEQKTWSEAYPAEVSLLRVAAGTGADTARVTSCLRESGPAGANDLKRSRDLSFAAGLTYTPVWAVNGRIVPWVELEKEIENAIREAR